jgi:hypothetical protein
MDILVRMFIHFLGTEQVLVSEHEKIECAVKELKKFDPVAYTEDIINRL